MPALPPARVAVRGEHAQRFSARPSRRPTRSGNSDRECVLVSFGSTYRTQTRSRLLRFQRAFVVARSGSRACDGKADTGGRNCGQQARAATGGMLGDALRNIALSPSDVMPCMMERAIEVQQIDGSRYIPSTHSPSSRRARAMAPTMLRSARQSDGVCAIVVARRPSGRRSFQCLLPRSRTKPTVTAACTASRTGFGSFMPSPFSCASLRARHAHAQSRRPGRYRRRAQTLRCDASTNASR